MEGMQGGRDGQREGKRKELGRDGGIVKWEGRKETARTEGRRGNVRQEGRKGIINEDIEERRKVRRGEGREEGRREGKKMEELYSPVRKYMRGTASGDEP